MDIQQFLDYLEQTGHSDETVIVMCTESGTDRTCLNVTLGDFKKQFNAWKIY